MTAPATTTMAFELPRDVIRVTGPEAASYLQGQLSQDVLALGPGDSALSLLLEPQGKISAFLRVTRVGEDHFVLDLDGGFGPATLTRLSRFRLRTKVDIEMQDDWRCVAVRGRDVARPPGPAGGGAEVVTVFEWPPAPALGGTDLLGPAPEPPAGVAVGTASDYEALRIEGGLPAMGAELDDRTIPEESGLVGATVSFTKGCYTGQELVARIEARGSNVPRRLRGVLADERLAVGTELWTDREIGVVTSTAVSPRLGPVALAYVRRGVDPPVDAEARTEGGTRTVSIRALPLSP
ncbi:MAG TPA: glycine cleavage T C-terminal barrel domain-containing protein [Acidimicrobiales bacterium]|nr:glycine cleavage T C-terminal barrel domain-containing protein [Acidimicrobiales bacterium]